MFFDTKKDRLHILLNPFEGMLVLDKNTVKIYENDEWKEINFNVRLFRMLYWEEFYEQMKKSSASRVNELEDLHKAVHYDKDLRSKDNFQSNRAKDLISFNFFDGTSINELTQIKGKLK